MKILLVEDDKDCGKLLEKGLIENAFLVDWEKNGEKAFWMAKYTKYDLIIVDIHIPNRDGIEIINGLRKLRNATPCLIISVRKELNLKLKAFDVGADDYLIKPFSLNELIARINAITRRGKNLKNSIYELGNIQIDHSKYVVIKNGRRVKLRRKEYDLLYFLMKNQNKVLSRAYILEKVWDMNADPFTNTVDVHIRNLRKKIGDRHGKILKTIYGRGYEFSTNG